MTCIVGCEWRGRVWLGGDSAISWGDGRTAAPMRKVRRCSRIVLGVAGGMAEVGAVLTWSPPRYDDTDSFGWLVAVLAPTLRDLFRTDGIKQPEVDMLVGIGGTLYSLDVRGGAHPWEDGYGAAGSGSDVALGALHALAHLQPRTRLRRALEAASAHCSSVAPPYAFASA